MPTSHEPPLPQRHKRRYLKRGLAQPSLNDILEDICKCFNQPPEMVKSSSRKRKYVICRRIYCYVASVITYYNCSRIAEYINRDHSSFIYQEERVISWFKLNDPLFMDEWYDYIESSSIWNKYYEMQISVRRNLIKKL